jgi:hypothetical protein
MERDDRSIVSLEMHYLPRMAPNLPESSHEMIRDMITSKFENVEIAKVIGYSPNTVRSIGLNAPFYRTTKAPLNGGGRKRSITPPMLVALREQLQEKPSYINITRLIFCKRSLEYRRQLLV